MIIDLLYALIFEPQLASCVDITESKEVMQRTMISNMLHLELDDGSAIERLLRYKLLSLGLNFNDICIKRVFTAKMDQSYEFYEKRA